LWLIGLLWLVLTVALELLLLAITQDLGLLVAGVVGRASATS
jgi:hypothetical protein